MKAIRIISINIAIFVALAVICPPNANAQEQAPLFMVDSGPIPTGILAKMKQNSWHDGCPVPYSDLIYMQLTYWGFDGKAHVGELIVHEKIEREISEIFSELYNNRFAIEKMKLIDEYGGDDGASMADNNTSAFNCRYVSGTKRWSRHAYGMAIDINPLINPYVQGKHVSPEAGEKYLDRKTNTMGMVVRGDPCLQSFRLKEAGAGAATGKILKIISILIGSFRD